MFTPLFCNQKKSRFHPTAVPDGVPNGVFSIYLFRSTVLTARRLFRTDKALPQVKRYIKNPLCRLCRHLPKGEQIVLPRVPQIRKSRPPTAGGPHPSRCFTFVKHRATFPKGKAYTALVRCGTCIKSAVQTLSLVADTTSPSKPTVLPPPLTQGRLIKGEIFPPTC